MRHTRLFVPILAILSLAVAPQASGRRTGRYTLNPQTYESPSGEYALRVNPSTIYGQGEGDYRMTRGGAEVWVRKLPFTLWDAAVADDGTVAGYAYSLGKENFPLDRTKHEDGKLHLVIIDPRRGLRLNDVLPRHGTFSCTSSVDRNVVGIIADWENDRLIVRTREGSRFPANETWRTYQLSTGKPVDEFEFSHPQEDEHEYWLLLSARPVSGTPLLILNWKYMKWDETGNQLRGLGGRFNLLDPAGNSVWELDRPGDYPDYYEYSKRLDEEKDAAEFMRLMKLEREIGEKGAVLRTDQPGHFDLWFVKENQQVTFEVAKGDSGSWRVTEQARKPHGAPVVEHPEKTLDKLEALTLRHLGTIELQIDRAPSPEIRDIAYFDVDGRGRIGFLRSEGDRCSSFLLVEPDGTIVWNLGLREVFGGEGNLVTATWLGGARWLLIAQVYAEPSAAQRWATRAWWLDTDAQKVTAIEPFTEGARHVAASHDGGFVVIIDPAGRGLQSEPVVAFDREGKERWRFDGAPEETLAWGRSSIAVMPDGNVIVSREYGSALTILSADGKFLRTFECERFFGPGADGKWLTPKPDGTLLLPGGYQAGHVWQVQLDGTVKQKLAIKHRDGRPVELAGFPDEIGVRVDQQGTMWACDKHALLRLSSDGVVEQVLGEPPDAPTLRSIGGAKIDQVGNVYLAEQRNFITHVFDTTGRRVRLLRPSPSDFESSGFCAIDVAADGRVFVNGLGFSPSGERLGFRKLPGGTNEPDFCYGRVRSQPHANRYWIVGREEAALVGEDDAVVTTLKRRPNGDWLDQIEGSAVAPDGSLVLAAGGMGLPLGDAVTLNLYGPSGEPLKTVALPALEGGGIDLGLAYSGQYVVAGPVGYEKPRYLLLDAGAEPPKWYDLGTLVPYEDRWAGYWFVRDGEELWMYAEQARQVERFAAPELREQPQSAPAAPTSAATPLSAADVIGKYYFGDGLGVNCYLELGNDGQFTFRWSGCLGEYDRNSGPWGLTDGLVILKPSQSNVREGFQGTATRLYPVRWGGRLYLVSDDEMIDFCSAVSLDWVFDREGQANGRSAFFYLRAGDEEKPLVGLPTVPEIYRQYLSGGFTASVIDVRRDGTFVINRGNKDGLIVGTKLNVAHGDHFGYVVVSTTDDQAVCKARSPRAARTDVKRGAAVRSFMGETQDSEAKP